MLSATAEYSSVLKAAAAEKGCGAAGQMAMRLTGVSQLCSMYHLRVRAATDNEVLCLQIFYQTVGVTLQLWRASKQRLQT